MVIMENCHRYDNNGAVDAFVNSTLVVCSWQSPPELRLRTGGYNGTADHCLVSAVCAAERAGYAVAIPAVCCVGILLNVVNLTILLTNRFPESSYSYLSALAVADLLSLLCFGVNGVGRGFYDGHRGWRAFEVYAYFPLGSSSTTASVFLTVTVTVERYAFIYHPLRSKAWCNRAVARRVVAAVALGSVAVNIPRFFAMRVGGSGQLEFTRFGLSAYYSSIVWIYFSVISVGSCVCLVVFNTLLIIGIHRTHRKRRALVGGGGGSAASANNKSRDEMTLTRTLIIVVCVFMVGELPSSFTSRSFFVALVGRKDHELLFAPGYRVAVLVSTGLVVAQHSLNFVVYCVFNRRFCAVVRHRLASMIFCNRPALSPQPPDPKVEPPPPPPEVDCNNGTSPFVPAKADV